MILLTMEGYDQFIDEIQKRTNQKVIANKIKNLSEEERAEVEIVLTFGTFVDLLTAEDLDLLPNVKYIHLCSSGEDMLPKEKMKEKGLILTTSRGIHGIPMSEYVMGALLYFAKKFPQYNELKDKKQWRFRGTYELHGQTIGILGTGVIGQAIAEKARAFGMIPIGVNRSGKQHAFFETVYPITELENHIGTFDHIVSVLPSNPGTKGLVNKDLISKMKDGIIFINVGRGDLIVLDDFIEAMNNNKFIGAALDVFEEEPLPKDSPLWEVENLLITPHTSGVSRKYFPRALDKFYTFYEQYKKNELPKL